MAAKPNEPPEDETARLRAEVTALQESVDRLMQELGRKWRVEAADTVDARLEEARTYVQGKPLQALGFAALAGLVFGLLFGRR